MRLARAARCVVAGGADATAAEDLTSPIEITNQAFAILIRGRTREQRALLGPNDIVIEPPLGRFPSADFSRVAQALNAGETGARDQAASLQKLALSPDEYVSYLATRNPRDASLPTIDFVRADLRSMEYDSLVKATMSNLVGKAMDADRVRGQLSSLLTGMDIVVTPQTDAMVMTLVDVPLVRVSTVTAVIDAWRRTRAPIVRPAIGDRHGHPVLFDRVLFDELRHAPFDAGAKSVVRAHEHEIVNVPVDDEGCVRDVDTPSDYEEMRGE